MSELGEKLPFYPFLTYDLEVRSLSSKAFTHERHRRDFKLSDVILGGQDGLVNVLGVILGVAAASGSSRLVLAAGLAATFAESISMAAVSYTSKLAQAEHYESEVSRELEEMDHLPEVETEEIRQIYKKRGFEGQLLEDVVKTITGNRKVWLSVMMGEELGLEAVDRKKILTSSLLVGLSAIAGSVIPLIPFAYWPIRQSSIISVILAGSTLMLLGAYKAGVTSGRPFRSGIQMAIIGILSALAGFAAGLLFKVS